MVRLNGARWAAGALLAVAVVLVCADTSAQQPGGATPQTAVGEVLEQILVKVNGDIITQTDLQNRQIAALRQQGLQLSTDADVSKALQEVTPRVISAAVDELLLVQQGRELGYRLTDEQFEQLVEGIKGENNFATDAEFVAALEASEGMTVDDLRRVMERQMLVNQVQQVEILQKVSITDIEAREYYDTHLEDFTEPAMVTLREILVAVPEAAAAGVNVVADEQARDEAIAARQRVLDGEDFARVAIVVSDAPSKANGGLIGPLDLAFLSETIQQLLDGLEVGDVSEPLRTPIGYQVLKLEARTDPTPLPFEEVRDAIADNVFSDRRIEEYAQYVDRLRAEAIIEWKDEAILRAYETFATERADQLQGVQ